jgi:2'-5' RNA ligase
MLDQLRLRWPPDWTKLHVYFLPDPAELKPLVDTYRGVLEGLDFLSPQPDEWLHATVAVVDGVPARDVPAAQRAELEQRLRQVLVGMAPFQVTCGPAIAGRSTVALDMVPDREFHELTEQVRRAAGKVFEDDAVQYSSGRPHITLAYAIGDGDSGILQAKLRNATDLRVALTVDTVHLVDVVADAERFQFRWEELAALPLAG